MSAKLTSDQLELVRRWAAQGVDLNGIQKKLVADCGVHMTYMDVRFLLLDHGIEIATASPESAARLETAQDKAAPATPTAQDAPASAAQDAPAAAKMQVELDDLQIPGTLLSGKADFPSGIRGAWQIDQMGRFGWSELSGTPSPEEMQLFETQLRQLLSRM